jgi:hypothetical protein
MITIMHLNDDISSEAQAAVTNPLVENWREAMDNGTYIDLRNGARIQAVIAALAIGGYTAVGTIKTDDLSEAYRITQNGGPIDRRWGLLEQRKRVPEGITLDMVLDAEERVLNQGHIDGIDPVVMETGAILSSWSRLPDMEMFVAGRGYHDINGQKYGYRSTMVGDIFILHGEDGTDRVYIVDSVGFLQFMHEAAC